MVNDISIASAIILTFILLGTALPFINTEYGQDANANDIQNLEDTVAGNVENVSTISAFTVLISILKMFFWTFGDLPFWLDAFFTLFRLLLAMIIGRNIWIGGGA